MNPKRYSFMSGLPRTGTTLMSVLAEQTEDLYVSAESSLADHARYFHQGIPSKEDVRLGNHEDNHSALFRGLLDSYYGGSDRSVIVDKARNWGMPYYIRLLNDMLGHKPRILVPVRPLAEVVTSILLHLQRNPMNNYVDRQMVEDDFLPFWRKDVDDARVDYLLRPGALLDVAMLSISTAMKGEADAEFLIFSYEELVSDTQETMNRIHEFTGAAPHQYELVGLAQADHQHDDEVLGVPGFHDVRPVVSRASMAPEIVLSDYALTRCSIEDFWTGQL